MNVFHWCGYSAEVDEQATRDWYTQAEEWACNCVRCRNFLALARERRLPEELLAILDGLSIPAAKATYVCELWHDEQWEKKGLLYEVSWRIAGAVQDRPVGKDNGPAWGPLVDHPWGGIMLGQETYPYGAPDFPEPHFDMDCTMFLPWALDESIDGDKTEP